MSNIMITPDLLQKLNINKYELFEYDVKYNKYNLKDYKLISLLIMEKVRIEIK